MKKLILSPLLLIIFTTAICRQANSELAPTYEFYKQKSKQQKTAATLVLLSGFVLTAGTLLISSKIKSRGKISLGIVYGIIMAGAICFPVSLSLYIASSFNNSTALHNSFKKKAPTMLKHFLLYTYVP